MKRLSKKEEKKRKESKKVYGFRISDELAKPLKIYCTMHDIPMYKLVEKLIADFLRKEKLIPEKE